jgi:hypothetical protein
MATNIHSDIPLPSLGAAAHNTDARRITRFTLSLKLARLTRRAKYDRQVAASLRTLCHALGLDEA